MKLSELRKEYNKLTLLEDELPVNPFDLFRAWFDDCLAYGVAEPNAMVLATASEKRPSARVVLLKELNDEGFVFYTNYDSRKGKELAENKYAALTFFWPEPERQVRVEGEVKLVSNEVSELYFNERPIESRVSASVSPQSRVVPSREYLETLHREFCETHQDGVISKPGNWGGFVLVPDYIEFWQGRPNRLHDRIVYQKVDGGWKTSRLAP